MASKIDWQRLPRSTIVAEVVQAFAAVACLALGWVTFPLVYALAGIEVLTSMALSAAIYRQRGVGQILLDLLKGVAMWLFCGVFVLGAYYASRGFADGLRIEPRAFAVLAGLAALRLGWAAVDAFSSTDMKLHWTREVAMRAAALAVTLFFAAFACLLPGIPLAALIAKFAPDVAADVSLGLVFAAVQAFFGCIVATMSPEELAAVSRQPYHKA